MADFTVPLNRVGVVRAVPIDSEGEPTSKQMDNYDWSLFIGSDSYFELVVAADGLSAEIRPIAEGSGGIAFAPTRVGDFSFVTQSRTVEIIANASDSGESGNDPKFAGLKCSIVHPAGRLI